MLKQLKTSYLKFLANILAMALLWESTVVAVRSQKLSVHIKIIAENNTRLLLCPLKALTIFVTVMGPVTLLYVCNFISTFCCLLQDKLYFCNLKLS